MTARLDPRHTEAVTRQLRLFLQHSDHLLDARLVCMEPMAAGLPQTVTAAPSETPSFLTLYRRARRATPAATGTGTVAGAGTGAAAAGAGAAAAGAGVDNPYLRWCSSRSGEPYREACRRVVRYPVRVLLGRPSLPAAPATAPDPTRRAFDLRQFHADQAALETRLRLNQRVLGYLDVLLDATGRVWHRQLDAQQKDGVRKLKEVQRLYSGADTPLGADRVRDYAVFERLGPMVDALRAEGPFHKWLQRYHEVIRCQTDVLQFMVKGPQEAAKAAAAKAADDAVKAVVDDAPVTETATITTPKVPVTHPVEEASLQQHYADLLSKSPVDDKGAERGGSYRDRVLQLLRDQRVVMQTHTSAVPATPWRTCLQTGTPCGHAKRPLFFDAAMADVAQSERNFGKEAERHRTHYGVSFGGALWQYLLCAVHREAFVHTQQRYTAATTDDSDKRTAVQCAFELRRVPVAPRPGTRKNRAVASVARFAVVARPYVVPAPKAYGGRAGPKRGTRKRRHRRVRRTATAAHPGTTATTATHSATGPVTTSPAALLAAASTGPAAATPTEPPIPTAPPRTELHDSLFLNAFFRRCVWPAPGDPTDSAASRYYTEATKDVTNGTSKYDLHPTVLLTLYTKVLMDPGQAVSIGAGAGTGTGMGTGMEDGFGLFGGE